MGSQFKVGLGLNPYVRMAVFLAITVGIGLGVRALTGRSEVDKGIASFRYAYRNTRPLESRISDLGYAPWITMRGAEDEPRLNGAEHDRAEVILLGAALDHPGPASEHALGEFYLADKQFVEAVNHLSKAVSEHDSDAQYHCDLGAALLEKAKAERKTSATADDFQASAQAVDELAQGLEHLAKALELKPFLPEALFNKALCHEEMMLPRLAEEDWKEYVAKDPHSAWATEGQEHLRSISDRSDTPEDIGELGFLDLCKQGDRSQQWEAIRRSREPIVGKMLSHQLAKSFVRLSLAGDPSASATLAALERAGELELTTAQDHYSIDVARYYRAQSDARLRRLQQGLDWIDEGHSLCLKAKYSAAIPLYANAARDFSDCGDSPQAMFAQYWIGYASFQAGQTMQCVASLEPLLVLLETKKYKWLLAQSLNALANAKAALNDYSAAIKLTAAALDLSKKVDDPLGLQKNLFQIANEYCGIGNYRRGLASIGEGLDRARGSWPGTRQMWRDYDTSARILGVSGRLTAAADYMDEGLRLAVHDEPEDPSLAYTSHVNLGMIYGKMEHFPEALMHARLGYEISQRLAPSSSGFLRAADSELQLGDLYRQSGDPKTALEYYDRAVELSTGLSLEVTNYKVHTGRFQCYVALGDDQAAKAELETVLALFEGFRSSTLEEENRNSFFSTEQSVYDLATDFALFHLNQTSAALDYSELSRARSLLGLLSPGNGPDVGNSLTRELPSSVRKPVNVADLQARIPAKCQVVEYGLLRDRIVIWVITSSGIEVRIQDVPLARIESDIRKYVDLISKPTEDDPAATDALGARLYSTLIEPIAGLLDANKIVCFVPDKVMARLPFSSLISPTSGRYLLEEFTTIVSPSLNVFLLCCDIAESVPKRDQEKLLCIGNPAFDRKRFPMLPNLSGAIREANDIAGLYPDHQRLIGSEATTPRVLENIQKADVLHFASHYIVDERSPILSYLVLAPDGPNRSDGLLSASDILRTKLDRAPLVVLSACETGIEGYYDGEGMVGMSRAFLIAGAPLVIGTLWGIDSEPSADLMIAFHKYRKMGGLPALDALRRAQRDVLRAGPGGRGRPYWWAGFEAIGGLTTF